MPNDRSRGQRHGSEWTGTLLSALWAKERGQEISNGWRERHAFVFLPAPAQLAYLFLHLLRIRFTSEIVEDEGFDVEQPHPSLRVRLACEAALDHAQRLQKSPRSLSIQARSEKSFARGSGSVLRMRARSICSSPSTLRPSWSCPVDADSLGSPTRGDGAWSALAGIINGGGACDSPCLLRTPRLPPQRRRRAAARLGTASSIGAESCTARGGGMGSDSTVGADLAIAAGGGGTGLERGAGAGVRFSARGERPGGAGAAGARFVAEDSWPHPSRQSPPAERMRRRLLCLRPPLGTGSRSACWHGGLAPKADVVQDGSLSDGV